MTEIVIITSCTGKKAIQCSDQLYLSDFQKGLAHVKEREQALRMHLRKAEDMYTGEQHLRLMKGVNAARRRGVDVDLWIVSAGYGVISGDRQIAPYDATFTGMSGRDRQVWAKQLGLQPAVKDILARPAKVCFLLLGDAYLDACSIQTPATGSRIFAFCGNSSKKRLPAGITPIALTIDHTRDMRVGLVGIKGEAMAKLLSVDPAEMPREITAQYGP